MLAVEGSAIITFSRYLAQTLEARNCFANSMLLLALDEIPKESCSAFARSVSI